MPQRSNAFQTLIHLIEAQLAPQGATVTESALLKDNQDGTEREIDVLVRIPAGDRELKVGIECRDHKRRADLPWVEAVKGKYEFLDVDRIVLVARQGFSRAAIARAKLWGIETLTIESAVRQDWSNRLHRVQSVKLILERVSYPGPANFVLETVVGKAFVGEVTVGFLTYPNGTRRTLREISQRAFETDERRNELAALTGRNAGQPIPVRMKFPSGTTLTDAAGTAWRVQELNLHIQVVREESITNLSFGKYNRTEVAHGEGAVGETKYQVVYTQKPGEGVRGKTLIEYEDGRSEFDLPEPFPD